MMTIGNLLVAAIIMFATLLRSHAEEILPRYETDSLGIHEVHKEFSGPQRELAHLFIEAFKEVYRGHGFGVEHGIEVKHSVLPYDRANHFFNDFDAVGLNFEKSWHVFLAIFPDFDFVGEELYKIQTMTELEALASNLRRAATVNYGFESALIALESRISQVPGIKRSKQDQYYRVVEALRDPDVQLRRKKLAFELNLNQVLLDSEELYFVDQVKMHLQRIASAGVFDPKSDYTLWTKLVPIVSYGGLRYYMDTLPFEVRGLFSEMVELGTASWDKQVSVRVYATQSSQFKDDYFGHALPLEFVRLVRSTLRWKPSESRDLILSQILPLYREILNRVSPELAEGNLYAMNRGFETVERLLRSEVSLPAVPPELNLSFFDLSEMLNGEFSFRFMPKKHLFDRDNTVRKGNFFRLRSVSSAEPVVYKVRYRDDGFSMSVSYDPDMEKYTSNMRCGLWWTKMANYLRAMSHTGEIGPIECHQLGIRLRQLPGGLFLNAITLQSSPEGASYFRKILGI